MKKIWLMILLLILLIFLCVNTKIDKIASSLHRDAPIDKIEQSIENKHISFIIKEDGNRYVLNGEFSDKEQPLAIAEIFDTEQKRLLLDNILNNDMLIGEDAILTTQALIPYFIENYKNGKVEYANNILSVSGEVENYEIKNHMEKLLLDSRVATKNETKVTFAKQQRDAKLKKERERKLAEKLAEEKLEAQRVESEKLTKKRLEAEKAEAEKLALAKIEAEKNKAKKLAREKLEQEKLEAQRVESEKLAEKRLETERKLAEEKLETRRVEAKKLADLKAREDKKRAERLSIQRAEAKANVIKLLKVDNIEFMTAQSTLTSVGLNTISKLGLILQQYPDVKVEIAGHTDSDGDDISNLALSQKRVDNIKNALMAQGLNENQLTSKGYGESMPLVPNTTDKNKQKNRRVEINIIGE